MPRPTTILLLLDAMALRADIQWRRGRAETTKVTRVDRGQSDAADAIDRLAIGVPFAGPVLVLCDEVFLQTIDLPARAIAGLDARSLTKAIAFEAQSFSGIAGETATDWWRRGDDREFLVAQFGRGDFAAIAEAVERGQGSLLGVAHPAGMPIALGEGDGAFCRHEEWGTLRAVVRGNDTIAEHVRVARSTAAPLAETPKEHLVLRASIPVMPGALRFDLGDEDVLTRWLVGWAEAMSRRIDFVVLTPPESASVRNRRWLHAGILMAAVIAAGALDRVSLQRQVVAATKELTAARAPLDRLVAAEAEVDSLTRQLAALRAGPVSAAPPAAPWSARAAMVMLEQLAAARPDGVVLDELAIGWRRCQVRGRAPDPASADRWAAALASPLGRIGYSVQPTSRQQLPAEQGGLFDFRLEFHGVQLATAASAPAEDGR